MYKFKSKQISFFRFWTTSGNGNESGQPMGQEIRAIPWTEIELKYAELFANGRGNVAKPLHLAPGALIIQLEYGFSDEETALIIQESPYLQYFWGFTKYEYKMPIDPSLMVYFRKRLTPSIVGEINEMIIKNAEKEHSSDDDDGDGGPGGSRETKGTLIVDATCTPSDIKSPQDIELLNKARKTPRT